MTGTIRATANDILNQVGVEVGLDPVNDPFSSTDQSYRQLRYLINTVGEELSQAYPWDFLRGVATIITNSATNPDGKYDLPSDFLYLLNQSGWDQTNRWPLAGPITPQEWQYLEATLLSGNVLQLGFRLMEDKICFLPAPPDNDLTIKFEYISRNWVLDSTTGTTYIDKVQTGADQPMFNRTLMQRGLKVKFLEAKGFDSSKAQADYNQAFQLTTARNKGAKVLNLSARYGYQYLGPYNAPDTGYGT